MPFEHGPNWKGGQRVDQSGHMRVWNEAIKKYVPRSHLVWFEHHPEASEISRGYVIHHKDGDKLNDVIDNLECIPLAEHVARHRRAPEEYIELLQQIIRDLGGTYPPRHS